MNDNTSSLKYSRNRYSDAESLRTNGRIMAEYIWIGGFGDDIRSKTMVCRWAFQRGPVLMNSADP